MTAAVETGEGPAITVFHLVWAPFGPGEFAGFLDSYRARPAGVDHRLHVLYNGFAAAGDVAPYEAIAADVPHDSTVLDRPVQDIRAYLDAARAARTAYVCYLNSYARILADGWLAMLHRQLLPESVGIVGATGACESHYSEAVRYLEAPFRPGRDVRKWWGRYTSRRAIQAELRRTLPSLRDRFPPFPNPHLRTNAILLDRATMLDADRPVASKDDAYEFESGRSGLTARVLASGRRALVVGRDGRGYPVAEWEASRTFRAGDQSNLLVSDNQTRAFAEAPPAARAEMTRRTWHG